MLLDHIQLCIYDNNAFITAEFVKVSEKKQSQKSVLKQDQILVIACTLQLTATKFTLI